MPIENKKYIFLVIGIVFMVFVLFLIYNLSIKTEPQIPEEHLVEIEGLPISEWPRRLTVESENNMQVVTNVADGYSITVTNAWDVPSLADTTGGLKILHEDTEEEHGLDEGHVDGGILSVVTIENPNKLGLQKWLSSPEDGGIYLEGQSVIETKINNRTALKTPLFPLFTEGWSFEEDDIIKIPIPDSLQVKYITNNSSSDLIYIISCSASGEDHVETIQICEEQIQTFTVLK
ncbi:MAG: hypothetical protein WDZ39_00655 [Candidatus Spechtbacterales bacterium]